MKKLLLVLLFSVLTVAAVQKDSFAWSTTITPGSIDHGNYYTWRINWSLPVGEHITDATITYTNIYDWQHEADALYTNLLNSTTLSGWRSRSDSQSGMVNRFNNASGTGWSGGAYLLGTWNDPYGDSSHKATYSYSIPSTYFDWLSDGTFGFGIDPDCHYYMRNISFTINSAPSTPEPASMTLLGLGLLGIWGFGKKKK